MKFDLYASDHPELTDLAGLAVFFRNEHGYVKQAALGYMANIIRRIRDIDHDYVIREVGKVMNIYEYVNCEGASA